MPSAVSYFASRGEGGFSLAEMVVTVAVLGILAAIAIPAIIGAVTGSKQAVADGNLALLNEAVIKYNHANTNYVSTPSSSADDEVAIFQMLQTRDTTIMGSPFMSATMSVSASSDDKTYRAYWNGRAFELVTSGSGGAGLNLLDMKETGGGH